MSAPEFQITLPPCTQHPAPGNTFRMSGPLVIVGANGSGKSRLAVWLERQDLGKRHRVSAQRSLTFPEKFEITTLEIAEKDLLHGANNYTASERFIFRWNSRPDSLLADFDKLLRVLLIEAAQVREAYDAKMRQQRTYESPPDARLDVIRRIWEEVLPHRELIPAGFEIKAQKRGDTASYAAREMSDGERVIFYLIGQCLCAPKDSTIILDEPELHLHQALQARLWDAVEASRRDCLFVYITHDLDFAASRTGGTHVWLQEYSANEQWEWDFVPMETGLPQALVLELLGSRKPVLLVEGVGGGLDESLYRLLYPGHHVQAFGGCQQVIHATATCRALHSQGRLRMETSGLVDNDGRTADDVARLAESGVRVLEWSEIENLLVCEEALRHVSEALHRDVEADVAAVKTRVLKNLADNTERVACELAGGEINRLLGSWSWKHDDEPHLNTSLAAHLQGIDAARTVARWRTKIQGLVAAGDYRGALRLYPNKGLHAMAGQVLGLRDYGDYVLRRLASPEGQPLVAALQGQVPVL